MVRDRRENKSEKKKSYLETYGAYIEETERRKVAQAEDRWNTWLKGELPFISDDAARFLDAAVRLLPPSVESPKELAWKALLCQVMVALHEGDRWNEGETVHVGQMVPDRTFFPTRSLANILVVQSGLCTVEEFDLAMNKLVVGKGEALFQEEGALTESQCGTFWQQVIQQLPVCYNETESVYRNNCLYLFWSPGADDELEDTLYDCINELLLLTTSTFTGVTGAEADKRNTRILGYFMAHWIEANGTYDSSEPLMFTDPDIEQLLKLYPKLTDWWTVEELADTSLSRAGLLDELYRADPQDGIAAWHILAKTSEPLTDPKTARNFLYEMEPIWLDCEDDPELLRPMLEEFQRNEALARQVFQSAYVNYFQQNIIKAAQSCGKYKLARHLFDLLMENPLPHEEWEEPFEDFCALLPPAMAEDSEVEFYHYCRVRFEGIKRPYAYLTNGLPVRAGDHVLVPFGRESEPREGRVTSVLSCTREDAPWPPEDTKPVLKILQSDSPVKDPAPVPKSEPVPEPEPEPNPEPVPVSDSEPTAASAPASSPAPKPSTWNPPVRRGLSRRKKAILLCSCGAAAIVLGGVFYGLHRYKLKVQQIQWNSEYLQAEELVQTGDYEEALSLLEGNPRLGNVEPSLQTLIDGKNALQSEDIPTLCSCLGRLTKLASKGPYKSQAAALRDMLKNTLYRQALAALASGQTEQLESAFSDLGEFHDAPVLLAYVKALAASKTLRSTTLDFAAKQLEAIPADYSGPFAAEITTLRQEFLPKQIETYDTHVAAVAAGSLPYIWLPEELVNSTVQLGTADEVLRQGISTFYKWYNDAGTYVFLVICRNGVVTTAQKKNGDTCWKGDKLIQNGTPETAPVKPSTPPSTRPSGPQFGHSSGGGTSGGDTGPGSGSSLREDYDDPEDLYEDGDYDDLDEAWDEWEEGY